MRNNTNLTILNGSEMKKIRIIDKTKIFLSTTRHTFKCSKQLNQKKMYLFETICQKRPGNNFQTTMKVTIFTQFVNVKL